MAVTWERFAFYDELAISSYRIATGKTVTIADYEQILVADEYIIEGTGTLEIDGTGSLNIIDGPNTGERDAVFTAADETKLDGIEASATADQTGAEIKALYEAEVNAFTDTKNTKLAGIESEATKYPDTGEQAFLDADHTKLNGIESGADATDTTNVNAAGALMESDFGAGTFQYATSDNTPQPKTPTQVRDILNIGQTSENLIKNSGFWACSRLSSLVSTGSAPVEDDAANDDTADWTKSNCTLVFDTDHYVIDPSANYAYIKIAATLKPGHLYKVRFDVKDGTSAGVSITLRVDSCSSETKTTTVAFVSEYFTFHAPLASNWIYLKFGTDPGGNVQIKNFSVYEYNPQFTSTYGADWHRITSTITAERICEDYTHCRGFYGMKLTKGVDTAEYYTFSSATPLPPEYAEVIGMTTVFGMYVYSVSAADNVKIQIVDSAGTTESAFIAADTLTWIEISRSIASNITTHDIRVLLDGDTGDVAYISFCKYSLGDTIGDGNWSHPKNEIVTLELYKDSPFFVANGWSDYAYWQTPQGDSGGAVSAQVEAVMIEMYACDSASAVTWAYFAAGPGGNTSWTFVLNLSGLVNDASGWQTGWIHCHRDGRFYFDLEASGSGTFDLGRFRYKAIMVK